MFIRMVNKKAKWEQDKKKDINEISSDVITNCLKTSDETLSLWYIENEYDMDKALIALSSNRDLVNKLDYIVIPDENLKMYTLEVKKSPGDSPFTEFNDNHYNIIDINYLKLGEVSKMILDLINNDGKIVRVHEKEIKQKLINALNNKLINVNDVKGTLLLDIIKNSNKVETVLEKTLETEIKKKLINDLGNDIFNINTKKEMLEEIS